MEMSFEAVEVMASKERSTSLALANSHASYRDDSAPKTQWLGRYLRRIAPNRACLLLRTSPAEAQQATEGRFASRDCQ